MDKIRVSPCGFYLMVCFMFLAVVWPQPVQAGEVEVATWNELVQALNRPHAEETIRLTADISGIGKAEQAMPDAFGFSTEPAVVKISGFCTLDLGGHTVEVALDSADNLGQFIGVNTDGHLILKNGTIRAMGRTMSPLVNFGQMELSAVNLQGFNGFIAYPQSQTTVLSGAYTGTYAQGGEVYGDISIQDGVFNGGLRGFAFGAAHGGEARLTGGTYSGEQAAIIIWDGAEPLKKIIPDHVGIEVDGRPLILSNESKLTGRVVLSTSQTSLLTSVFRIGNTAFTVESFDGKRTETMDVAPYIKNGRTMLPLRFVGESLRMHVDFDSETRDILIMGDRHSLTLNLDHNRATLDGKAYALTGKPENINGRTMLPIGELADLLGLSRGAEESLNGHLRWDGEQQTVTIRIPVAASQGL